MTGAAGDGTQDDVKTAVTVEVTHVYACRGFTLFLQKQHAVKGAEDLACCGWRVASAAGREDQSERARCEPRQKCGGGCMRECKT
jgi:hypothetical protein